MDTTSHPKLPRRQRIRLGAQAYSEPGAICSITIAARDRQAVFSNRDLAQGAIDILGRLATRTDVPVYAYCVMPDHIHLLIGPSPSCDIIAFAGRYKNLVQRKAWSVGIEGRIWQGRFWDHFLRADEDVDRVIDYILHNPVRRGLVDRREDYRYSGSFVFAVKPDGGGQAPALR